MDGVVSTRGAHRAPRNSATDLDGSGPGSASASEHGGEEEWERVSVAGSASEAGDREVDAVLEDFMMVGIGEDSVLSDACGAWDRVPELECGSMPGSARYVCCTLMAPRLHRSPHCILTEILAHVCALRRNSRPQTPSSSSNPSTSRSVVFAKQNCQGPFGARNSRARRVPQKRPQWRLPQAASSQAAAAPAATSYPAGVV